ncbi:uncharacterized protein si:ch211-250c4.3 isoform X2 [Takifugu flavidus]|uniref:uncharacterized protein si:ch211-250c4.3 isoform X2 n=1 Tax=Takifugu flavidus TaxID=433684 RepID=UPI002544A879|nr:uncharacterized protein si:ch211-250c4.3 isoform X2 [Takifugu flavidus]
MNFEAAQGSIWSGFWLISTVLIFWESYINMSVKGKKPGLIISWHRSFSILAPWKKGRGNTHPVLDSEVVLTKMKLLNNLHQKHLVEDATNLSLKSCCEQESTKASQINLHLDENSTELRPESCSDFISTVFSEPELPRLCKFESEDSGVELPSGANSPSTPSASEQSFVVHSRESSCDSCNSKPDSTLCPYTQNSDTKETEYLVAADPQDLQPEEHSSSTTTGDLQEAEPMDIKALVISPERGEDVPEKLRENSAVTEGSSCKCTRQCGKECAEITSHQFEPEPLSSESLEEYMDHCCRISQSQQESSSPLGSGLGYLQHMCQLIEKIGQLQETNLRLQRQISSLQKDSRMTKTKEVFFQQQCSCGAASLAFQDVQKRHSRSSHPSSSNTLSDLSTISEVTRHPLRTRRDLSSEDLFPFPLWRRDLNRRSYTEGEAHFCEDSSEGPPQPQHRLCESYTWGRAKDLVKKTRLRNQSKLRLSSTSLKMSCPQLSM